MLPISCRRQRLSAPTQFTAFVSYLVTLKCVSLSAHSADIYIYISKCLFQFFLRLSYLGLVVVVCNIQLTAHSLTTNRNLLVSHSTNDYGFKMWYYRITTWFESSFSMHQFQDYIKSGTERVECGLCVPMHWPGGTICRPDLECFRRTCHIFLRTLRATCETFPVSTLWWSNMYRCHSHETGRTSLQTPYTDENWMKLITHTVGLIRASDSGFFIHTCR